MGCLSPVCISLHPFLLPPLALSPAGDLALALAHPLIVEGEAGMRGVDADRDGAFLEQRQLEGVQIARRNVDPVFDEILFREIRLTNSVDAEIVAVVALQRYTVRLDVLVRSESERESE